MNRSLLLIAVAMVAAPSSVARQAPPDTLYAPPTFDAAEALLEELVEEAVSADPADLLEMLQDLVENPLDINRAGQHELTVVPAITPRLAASIVRHRASEGPFGTLEDLLEVGGMTHEAFDSARPFLVVREGEAREHRFPAVPSVGDVRRGARVELLQRVQRRMERSRGYEPIPDSLLGSPDEPRRYLGSPERVYTRLRAVYRRNLSVNLTLEKDPGEPFTWEPETGFYGYDFTSFHVAALQMGRIEALVLGDFVAEFGQGLTLWRAAGFGKGREPVSPLVRRGRGIRPYGSTDENRFFRGLATTVAVTPMIYVTGFASRRSYDARFIEADSTDFGHEFLVAGMPQTGLHRTRAEIENKNALGQTLGGGSVEVRLPRATLGVVGYQAAFDYPITRGAQPYQRFAFEGDRATMVGAYGNLTIADYHFFGEAARSPGGAFGGIGGIEAEIGPLDAVLLARHYPANFTSLHGYAFGERNGVSQNETGVYLGIRLHASPQWIFSGYFDQFRFPWARFGVNRPSVGHDGLLAVDFRPRQWLSFYLQARSKTRETGLRITTDTGAELDALTEETRSSLRLQSEYVASRDLRLRTRVEASHYHREDRDSETGVLLFHDIRWAARSWLTVDARLTYFETQGFGARLYQFEGDLHGVMTNALLYGRGTRFYTVVSLRPGGQLSGLDARFKLAITSYRDRHTIGSGLDAIDGSTVHDIGLQVRYRLGG